jgi:hypothetical protein
MPAVQHNVAFQNLQNCLIPKHAFNTVPALLNVCVQPLLPHTDCTRQEGLDFPCLEDDHPALPYRVPTTPVLWLFFSAHIPESTGYTNINYPSEELGAARTRRTFAGMFERASCWNRFFRPSNPFPATKRRFRMFLPRMHGGIRCRIVPLMFRL